MVAALLLLVTSLPALAGQKPPKPAQPGMHRAQKHQVRQQIDNLEETWRTAVLKADIPTLESLLSEDYISISATGTLLNREQTLDHLRSGKLRFHSIELSDRKVRFYGNTALVISQAAVHGQNPEGEFSGNFRYARVYVRNEQRVWKIVSFEVSRIDEVR